MTEVVIDFNDHKMHIMNIVGLYIQNKLKRIHQFVVFCGIVHLLDLMQMSPYATLIYNLYNRVLFEYRCFLESGEKRQTILVSAEETPSLWLRKAS